MDTFWDVYKEVIRTGHIFAGILWIGLLYYFNFVQGAAFNRMEAAARNNAVINLVPLALHFFRYAALATILFGIAMIAGLWVDVPGYGSSDQFHTILIGASFGTIMMLNVWLIIWPNQKKVIAATTATVKEEKPAPPEQPQWARTALLASRTNVMLSVPMLFFMVAAPHLSGVLWG